LKSLTEIKNTLDAALGSPALFQLVNTRITLKTGVDLASIRATDDESRESVEKVLGALSSMGYTEKTLELVARRKK
jgi:hypothetical protein